MSSVRLQHIFKSIFTPFFKSSNVCVCKLIIRILNMHLHIALNVFELLQCGPQ